MEIITINGEEYAKVSDLGGKKLVDWSEHVCVICTNGWIFEGYDTDLDDDAQTELADAHVVRKWSNGRGIGGLARPEYKDEYTLDECGTIRIREQAIISRIVLGW